jgi:hypothetical protein
LRLKSGEIWLPFHAAAREAQILRARRRLGAIAVFKPAEDDFQNMCTMLGLMTLTWAWAENALALSIGIIDRSIEGVRGHREIPVSMKRRLKYLRTSLADVAELHSVKDIGGKLVEDFSLLNVRRNELVHGSAWQFEKGRFQSLSFTIKVRDYSAKHKRVDIADMVRFNVEVTKLADDATAFLLQVSKIFPES